MDRNFKKNDVVQHFKRELLTNEELTNEPNMYLYKIIGEAMHTESGEKLMIYKALYGEQRMFARPLEMFMEKVDKEKYPNVKQEYRLEKLTKQMMNKKRFYEIIEEFNVSETLYEGTHSLINWVDEHYPNEVDDFMKIYNEISIKE